MSPARRSLLLILSDDQPNRTFHVGTFTARQLFDGSHLDDGALVVHASKLVFRINLVRRVDHEMVYRGAGARLDFEAEFLHALTITRCGNLPPPIAEHRWVE